MATIRPASDLRENSKEILEEAQQNPEGVILTKDGYGHAVVISYETYERQRAEEELFLNLAEAELEGVSTAERHDADDVIAEMRSVIKKNREAPPREAVGV